MIISLLIGQRIIEEDVDLDNLNGPSQRAKERKTIPVAGASSIGDVRFAFSMDKLQEEYRRTLKEREEMDPKQDHQWIDKILLEMKKEIEGRMQSVTKLLKMTPPLNADQLSVLTALEDLEDLPYLQRWQMYCAWKSLVVDTLEERLAKIEAEYRSQSKELKDVETTETAEIIRSAAVVGITTTGAAKNKALLEHLKCKIGKSSHCRLPFHLT